MRRLVILLVGAAWALGALASPGDHKSAELIGTWRGTSTCADRVAAPGCHDEVVVYEFTAGEKPGSVHWKADKVVEGKREPMGEMDLVYDARGRCWTAEFHSPRVHSVWCLVVDGAHLTGTGRLLPGKQTIRRIDARKDEGAGATTSLSSSALLNMEYSLPEAPGDRVAVRDGTWHEEAEQGRRSLTILDTGARGDLDADGVPDAIVQMVYSSGGTGNFHYLAAVLSDAGRTRQVSSVALGDRVQLRSVICDKGRIVATLLVQGEQDPMCCPTVSRTRVFELVHQRLVEAGGT